MCFIWAQELYKYVPEVRSFVACFMKYIHIRIWHKHKPFRVTKYEKQETVYRHTSVQTTENVNWRHDFKKQKREKCCTSAISENVIKKSRETTNKREVYGRPAISILEAA